MAVAGSDCFNIECVTIEVSFDSDEAYVDPNACSTSELNVKTSSASISDRTVSSINDLSDQPFKLKNITKFVVDKQEVLSFPKGLELFFPHLREITISSSKLESIRRSDLKPFPELEVIDLQRNEIEFLPDDLFEFNNKLKTVRISHNTKLKVLSEKLVLRQEFLERFEFDGIGCNLRGEYYNSYDNYNSYCLLPENLIEILAEDLNEKLLTLESKVQSLQLSFNSADGNLNAATKSLLITTKALQSCASSDVVSRFGEEQKIDLNCNMNNKTQSCKATDLKVQFENTRLEKLSNELIDPSELSSLTISKQQTLFLPSNLGQMFPNLEELIVTYSGLFRIDNSCLSGLSHLQVLTLKGNKIFEIPLNVFEEGSELVSIDLSENRIATLEVGVFNHLENLRELNLKSNFLISMTTEILKPLIKLETLNLSGNKLEFISIDLLTSIDTIEKADFANNNCINISFPEATKEIFEETFIDRCVLPVELNCINDGMKKTTEKEVTTGVCYIQDLTIQYPRTKTSKVLFANDRTASDISTLKIVDQSIKFIPLQLSKVLPKLTSIVIINSNLTCLQKNDFLGLNRLKELEIRGNNLTSIEEGTFDDLTQLEVLDLSSNEIISLPPKSFLNLKFLKKLILSFNQLEKFTADLLPIKGTIEEFRINDNLLEMIEARSLRFLRNAKVIDFSNNTCIDDKYEKTNNNRKYLAALSGEIDLSCSSDD